MKNNKQTYSDIDYWASVLNESVAEEKRYEKACESFISEKDNDEQVDEAGEMFKVDDSYIKKATAALAPLKKSDKSAYDMALKYLDGKKGVNLVMSPQDFAAHRIGLAKANDTAADDTRTNDQRRADAIKAVADKWKTDPDLKKEEPKHVIKSIWVKELNDNTAKVEYTYVDGKVEEVDEDVAVSEGDKYYKEVRQALRAGRIAAKNPAPVTKKDVQLSMFRVAFASDDKIVWFFGKNKLPESAWTFSKDVKKQAKSSSSPLTKGALAWQSEHGTHAKIYKTK